ncbi:calcium-dependent protein kinase 22-like [Gigantopelta aegis]|uniref:calcium-dependent protein kinase 22-like n=1 Tax=Gigantopelta aegis TaxID=1735272 RepID=UPI001B887922|nr:calcium-dependent protein kinase 22-like [Gigantopelta aegis]
MLGLLSATFFVGKLLQPYLQLSRDDAAPTAAKPSKSPPPPVAAKPITATSAAAAATEKPIERAPVPVKVTSIAKSSAVPVAVSKPAKTPAAVPTKPKLAVPTKMTEAWAQSQFEKFSFDFDEADTDKSGNLSYSEVKAILEKRGWKGTEDEAKKIFAGLDMTKDGKVTKVEYVAAVKKIPKVAMKEMALRRAFNMLDKDKSGTLTRAEIAGATSKDCGLDMKAEKISDLLAALAKDDNQKLDYEEFLAVFGIQQVGHAMEVAFKLIDTDGSGFLTKEELINAVRADEELGIQAEKISALLNAWCKDDDKKITYKEFVKVWMAQKPKKK